MNRLTILLCTVCFLCACSTTPHLSHSVLMTSLSVGVQEQSAVSRELANTLFASQDNSLNPNYIDYRSVSELSNDLTMGNYDVVIGLLESFGTDITVELERIALKELSMRYFLLPEQSGAKHINNRGRFFSHMKSIGYVSAGKVGEINKSLVLNHPNAYIFEACGSAISCVAMLQKKHIDAFVTTGISSNSSWEDSLGKSGMAITRAKFYERQTFGLILNTQSVNQKEVQRLTNLFSQKMLPPTSLNAESPEAVVNTEQSQFALDTGE